ncbi:hypothetical protein AB4Z42_01030 [Mycobacterium sp. 2YAF39]|uniref:hypothetical protein n=1 Tax=Mycobacterium sp. 2YAF39 TaxID=3233033 RepID=UPI003F9783CE
MQAARVEEMYELLARYPVPADIWVCEQCGPEWTAESIRAAPLRSLSLPQLTALHVMSLDDDSLRHFFPRLMELMLTTPAPVFDFRLADLSSRLPMWQPDEQQAVRRLAEAIWSQRLDSYPCRLGYFSDCPSALDLLAWCDLDLAVHLDLLKTAETHSAARHLADLIDAVFTMRDPFESASNTTVRNWLRDPSIGERLQAAFFAADSDDASAQLSRAHEMWTVCAR